MTHKKQKKSNSSGLSSNGAGVGPGEAQEQSLREQVQTAAGIETPQPVFLL